MNDKFPIELETGVTWQDRQHKELYRRAVELLSAVEHNAALEESLRLLDFLDEYVVVHFDNEEKAMSEALYPDFISHVEEHHRFIDELTGLRNRFSSETGDERVVEVRKNVKEWIENHIGVLDKKAGQFLLKSGATGAR